MQANEMLEENFRNQSTWQDYCHQTNRKSVEKFLKTECQFKVDVMKSGPRETVMVHSTT